MRSTGGEPAVMCMSLAPFSTMARRSCCRLYLSGSAALGAYSSAIGLVPHGDAADLLGRGDALEHHLLQGLVEAHDLVEGDAALVARAVAGLAARALEELGPGDLLGGH